MCLRNIKLCETGLEDGGGHFDSVEFLGKNRINSQWNHALCVIKLP